MQRHGPPTVAREDDQEGSAGHEAGPPRFQEPSAAGGTAETMDEGHSSCLTMLLSQLQP